MSTETKGPKSAGSCAACGQDVLAIDRDGKDMKYARGTHGRLYHQTRACLEVMKELEGRAPKESPKESEGEE